VSDAITFAVTREQLERGRVRLAEMGLPLEGDYGLVERDGYAVAFVYDEAMGDLTLELRKKPWAVPAALIRRKLKAALAAEGIFERT
jgi:hypothetical protein